jgi:3-oxoacyl-[acyl-carrier protein] reductase
VLLMSRDANELRNAAEHLGEGAGYVAADMAFPGMAETVRQAIDADLGGLDGVLVNAGGPPPGEVLSLTDDQWLGAFQVLIGGPIRLLRTLVPLMSEGSAILFVTSSSVRQPVENLDASNVLRPGVASMVKCLARELAPAIRVNSLAPGRFDTDRVRSIDANRAKRERISVDEARAVSTRAIPMGRYGQPREFGRVGAFLLSPAASYVSGTTLLVDGAMVTAVPYAPRPGPSHRPPRRAFARRSRLRAGRSRA